MEKNHGGPFLYFFPFLAVPHAAVGRPHFTEHTNTHTHTHLLHSEGERERERGERHCCTQTLTRVVEKQGPGSCWGMAVACAGFTGAEMEFLAEEELVTVVPNMSFRDPLLCMGVGLFWSLSSLSLSLCVCICVCVCLSFCLFVC